MGTVIPGSDLHFQPAQRLPGTGQAQGPMLLAAPPELSHLSEHRATRERGPAASLSWREGRSCVHVEIQNHCLPI